MVRILAILALALSWCSLAHAEPSGTQLPSFARLGDDETITGDWTHATGSDLTLGNLGMSFNESDTNPTCTGTEFHIYADDSENKFKKCENGVLSDLDTGGGGADSSADDWLDTSTGTEATGVDVWIDGNTNTQTNDLRMVNDSGENLLWVDGGGVARQLFIEDIPRSTPIRLSQLYRAPYAGTVHTGQVDPPRYAGNCRYYQVTTAGTTAASAPVGWPEVWRTEQPLAQNQRIFGDCAATSGFMYRVTTAGCTTGTAAPTWCTTLGCDPTGTDGTCDYAAERVCRSDCTGGTAGTACDAHADCTGCSTGCDQTFNGYLITDGDAVLTDVGQDAGNGVGLSQFGRRNRLFSEPVLDLRYGDNMQMLLRTGSVYEYDGHSGRQPGAFSQAFMTGGDTRLNTAGALFSTYSGSIMGMMRAQGPFRLFAPTLGPQATLSGGGSLTESRTYCFSYAWQDTVTAGLTYWSDETCVTTGTGGSNRTITVTVRDPRPSTIYGANASPTAYGVVFYRTPPDLTRWMVATLQSNTDTITLDADTDFGSVERVNAHALNISGIPAFTSLMPADTNAYQAWSDGLTVDIDEVVAPANPWSSSPPHPFFYAVRGLNCNASCVACSYSGTDTTDCAGTACTTEPAWRNDAKLFCDDGGVQYQRVEWKNIVNVMNSGENDTELVFARTISTGYEPLSRIYRGRDQLVCNTVAKPTCDVTKRGLRWMTCGGSGVADLWERCDKDNAAPGDYAWRTDGGSGVTDHGALTGLTDDDHSQYLLLAGRAGTTNNPVLSTTTDGTLTGSAASGGDLILKSTSHATAGDVVVPAASFHVQDATGTVTGQLMTIDGAPDSMTVAAPNTANASLRLSAPGTDGIVLSEVDFHVNHIVAGAPAQLYLHEDETNGNEAIIHAAPSSVTTASKTFIWPDTITNNGFLKCTVSGNTCTLSTEAVSGGALNVKEDNSTVDAAATALDFTETETGTTIVTSSPAGEANVDLTGYTRYAGRTGAQTLLLSKDSAGTIRGSGVGNGDLILQANAVSNGAILLRATSTQIQNHGGTQSAAMMTDATGFHVEASNGSNAILSLESVDASGTIDLKTNTNVEDELRLRTSLASVSGGEVFAAKNTVSANITDTAGNYRVLGISGTLTHTAGTVGLQSHKIINNDLKMRVTGNIGVMPNLSSVAHRTVYEADGVTLTSAGVLPFIDESSYAVANSGVISGIDHRSFSATLGVGASTTAAIFTGFRMNDPTGAGAVTTAVGLDVPNMTKATTSLSVRSAGGAVEMRHAGCARLGDTAACGANLKLDVQGSTRLNGLVSIRENATTGDTADVVDYAPTFSITSDVTTRFMDISPTITINAATIGSTIRGIHAGGAIVTAVAPVLSTFAMFDADTIIRNAAATTVTPLAPITFNDAVTVRSADNTVTASSATSFASVHGVSTVGGTSDAVVTVDFLTGLRTQANITTDTSGQTATATNNIGVWIQNPTSSGAGAEVITNNIGVDIDTLSAGGTTNIPIRMGEGTISAPPANKGSLGVATGAPNRLRFINDSGHVWDMGYATWTGYTGAALASDNTTRWFNVEGRAEDEGNASNVFGAQITNDDKVDMAVPGALTVHRMACGVDVAPDNGGGSDDRTFTLDEDGATTGVTCTITETATACTFTGTAEPVAAGALVSIRATASNNPSASDATCTIWYTLDAF